MRIAVIGAGGVGGGFGAALAKAGADVTFVARGRHLDAMLTRGLVVRGGRGETHIVPTRATDEPAKIGKVDVVLFCVKLWDVESAGARIKPLIGPDTAVIPLQNGIDAAERLIPILGAEAVMGGVAQISASIIKPGVIHQVGTFMRMIFGELDGRITPRGKALLKGNKILSPLSDEAEVVLQVVQVAVELRGDRERLDPEPLYRIGQVARARPPGCRRVRHQVFNSRGDLAVQQPSRDGRFLAGRLRGVGERAAQPVLGVKQARDGEQLVARLPRDRRPGHRGRELLAELGVGSPAGAAHYCPAPVGVVAWPAAWAAPRAPGATPRSWPSPAVPARPPPRKSWRWP